MDRARKREATSVRKKFQHNADVLFNKLVAMFVYGLVSSTNGLERHSTANAPFLKFLSQIRLASGDTVQTAKPITDDASLYMTIPVLDKCS